MADKKATAKLLGASICDRNEGMEQLFYAASADCGRNIIEAEVFGAQGRSVGTNK